MSSVSGLKDKPQIAIILSYKSSPNLLKILCKKYTFGILFTFATDEIMLGLYPFDFPRCVIAEISLQQ